MYFCSFRASLSCDISSEVENNSWKDRELFCRRFYFYLHLRVKQKRERGGGKGWKVNGNKRRGLSFSSLQVCKECRKGRRWDEKRRGIPLSHPWSFPPSSLPPPPTTSTTLPPGLLSLFVSVTVCFFFLLLHSFSDVIHKTLFSFPSPPPPPKLVISSDFLPLSSPPTLSQWNTDEAGTAPLPHPLLSKRKSCEDEHAEISHTSWTWSTVTNPSPFLFISPVHDWVLCLLWSPLALFHITFLSACHLQLLFPHHPLSSFSLNLIPSPILTLSILRFRA